MRKKVIFYDNNDDLCFAVIDISHSIIIIKGYDEFWRETSLLKLFLKEDSCCLENIICYEKYRNNGIATCLLNIVDYILKDYNGFIYGKYSPSNKSVSFEELDEITSTFYEKNGFTIITKKEYLENPSNYPELSEKYFEDTRKEFSNSIVFKKNVKKQNYRFIEKNNNLVEVEGWKNNVKNIDSEIKHTTIK